MKTRNGFVSNSSSSSFVVDKDDIHAPPETEDEKIELINKSGFIRCEDGKAVRTKVWLEDDKEFYDKYRLLINEDFNDKYKSLMED